METLALPTNGAEWIAGLGIPSWDAYFMGLVFLVAMRSPDQETKQGCVIADWDSKLVMGTGYNGFPRGSVEAEYILPLEDRRVMMGLPTKRPDKYFCMVHADSNACVNCRGTSDNAVAYLPMPPCEVCLGIMANMAQVKIRRIVYLEERTFPNTQRLLNHLPHIKLEKYTGPNPSDVLIQAAQYAQLRTTKGAELSLGSTKSYTGSAA